MISTRAWPARMNSASRPKGCPGQVPAAARTRQDATGRLRHDTDLLTAGLPAGAIDQGQNADGRHDMLVSRGRRLGPLPAAKQLDGRRARYAGWPGDALGAFQRGQTARHPGS